MTDQSNTTSSSPNPSASPGPTPSPPPARSCRGRRGIFVIALLAVAVVAGWTGNMLSTAFGQGFAWHAWHDGGPMGAFMGGQTVHDLTVEVHGSAFVLQRATDAID